MNTENTTTQRTDAETWYTESGCLVVDALFVQTLERENTALREALATIKHFKPDFTNPEIYVRAVIETASDALNQNIK